MKSDKMKLVKVQGTKAKTKVELANDLLLEVQSIIGCDYGVEIENIESFPYALRYMNYTLMDIEENGEPIIMIMVDEKDIDKGLEIHNLYYGYSLLVPKKYEKLVNKLSLLN